MEKKIEIGKLNDIYEKYGDLGFKVETPYGYKDITWCGITEKDADVYRCELENGMFVEGADLHRLKNLDGDFVTLGLVKEGELIQTIDGHSPIKSIGKLDFKEDLYDIQVDEVHQYYSNDIVSHNTTFSIDSLKFLLYGKTTKTDKNEQVFNQHWDNNELVVRGMVNLENKDIIIERLLSRKLKRNGDWNVTNKLNFYEVLPDGTEEQMNEEDSKQTTIEIKNSVGSESDFELVTLATARNLEDLIELTTTESGKLLTRFIGLEVIEKKSEASRKMYNDFAKTKKSNLYDTLTLRGEIDGYEDSSTSVPVRIKGHIEKIADGKVSLENENKELDMNKILIVKYDKERDDLLTSKKQIDANILTLNPSKLEAEIDELKADGIRTKNKIVQHEMVIKEMGVIEFDEDRHHLLTSQKTSKTSDLAVVNAEVVRLTKVVADLVAGGICGTCKRKLDDVDNTTHIAEHNTTITIKTNDGEIIKRNLETIELELTTLNETKVRVDAKLKLELEKDRFEIEIGGLRNTLKSKNIDLKTYHTNLEVIEFNKDIDTKVDLIKTKLAVCDHTKTTLTQQIERIKMEILTNEDEIVNKDKIIDQIKKEDEVGKLFKVYIEMVGKKGISKLVLRSVLPIINAEVQRLLEDVVDFDVEIFINDKNDIQFMLIKNDVEKFLKAGSGLEKTAASIALRCVLGKISCLPMPNFITFDEVLGKVAQVNIPLMKPLFDKITDMYETVFFITHNDTVKDWSTNIITIVKENDVSRISIK